MKTSFIAIITLLIGGLSTTTEADPYIGLGIGAAFYKADLTGLGGEKLDESGTGSKLYGGYSFNKYFAAEASIYNFAEASVGAVETSSGFNSAEASMKGLGAYAVGIYPLNREVNVMAKLGVLSWDADLRVNNTSGTNDGTDVAFALAASFAFSRELLATAEWEFFDSDNPELSMFSAGFKFIFR